MKSLDMTSEQLKLSLSRKTLLKNSSSSQMNLHSSKKMLVISSSQKNSDLFSKQLKKPSQDSTNSFSINKLGLNQSEQFSNKKLTNELAQGKMREPQSKRLKRLKNKSEVSNLGRPVIQHRKVPSSSQHQYDHYLNLKGTRLGFIFGFFGFFEENLSSFLGIFVRFIKSPWIIKKR